MDRDCDAPRAVDLAYGVTNLEGAVAAALLLTELAEHDQYEDDLRAKRAAVGVPST